MIQQDGLTKIARALPKLPTAEHRAAACILENPEILGDYSITDLAEAAGTSTAAIVRLCRRLHFSGYQDLKVKILVAHQMRSGTQLQRLEGEHPMAERIVAGYHAVLSDTLTRVMNQLMHSREFWALVSRIRSSGEVSLLRGFCDTSWTEELSRVIQGAGYRVHTSRGGKSETPGLLLCDEKSYAEILAEASTAGMDADRDLLVLISDSEQEVRTESNTVGGNIPAIALYCRREYSPVIREAFSGLLLRALKYQSSYGQAK